MKKILIIDLISKNSGTSFIDSILNTHAASIMPQAIAVWAEELGHEVKYIVYTKGDIVSKLFFHSVDIVFISSYTSTAYIAYALSKMYHRFGGATTILGGPHARAFPTDAVKYFSMVIGFLDKELLVNIIQNPINYHGYVSNKNQINSLPSLASRWRFIKHHINQTGVTPSTVIAGTLGCPYKCDFCVESKVDLIKLPIDDVIRDLKFINQLNERFYISWLDPNFGVRVNEYLGIIESLVTNKKIIFGMQSSLSFLEDTKTVDRMIKSNFKWIAPGIESWSNYNTKSNTYGHTPKEKMLSVSEHLNKLSNKFDLIQANLIFGLDNDEGLEPFELTKEFILRNPFVYPNFQILTMFGESVLLYNKMKSQGRIINTPYNLLDCSLSTNLVFSNYTPIEFYSHLLDLTKFSFSYYKVLKRSLFHSKSSVRWFHLYKKLTIHNRLINYYQRKIKRLIDDNRYFDFYYGNSDKIPNGYGDLLKKELGGIYEWLPQEIKSQFEDEE